MWFVARPRKTTVLVACAVAVVLAIGGAYLVFALNSGGGPDPVGLPSVSVDDPGQVPTSFDGTWTVKQGDSLVGYRVQEQFAFLDAPSEAAGRTTAVEGTMDISGTTIQSAEITADLSQLRSDKTMRDERMRTMGLETDSFPDATFSLTSPIDLGSKPAEGEVVRAQAKGDLTLHGVTNQVTIPLKARYVGGTIEVVGSLPIAFSDYDITPPSVGPVTVEDHGTMELQLSFVKAA